MCLQAYKQNYRVAERIRDKMISCWEEYQFLIKSFHNYIKNIFNGIKILNENVNETLFYMCT